MHRELIALLHRGHTVHISTVNNCRLILRSERGMLPAARGATATAMSAMFALPPKAAMHARPVCQRATSGQK